MSQPRAVLAGMGEPEKGGIHPLYRSPDLTILNIVWSPLMQLMPHEHRMWSLIGIYTGREDNIFWDRREGTIAAVKAAALASGSVLALPSDVIHSVTNPIEKLTGAIHIYGGDFFATPRSEWDPETLAEREWNIQRALKRFQPGGITEL
jgi:predicted metal-dependent enzyme (double-stranded beta helix superfamily)